MEILVMILLTTLAVLVVVRLFVPVKDDTIHEFYGALMMVEINEMNTDEDRREYLLDQEHRGMTRRCSCDRFALPFPTTRIKDKDLLHALTLCQPVREVIS